jgi:hypothetical protein
MQVFPYTQRGEVVADICIHFLCILSKKIARENPAILSLFLISNYTALQFSLQDYQMQANGIVKIITMQDIEVISQ